MRAGKFPRAKIIGHRSVWVEAEVYAWIAARPLRPLKGDAAQP
jgi:predicted DNA-binding transcriptional regulator AlpA